MGMTSDEFIEVITKSTIAMGGKLPDSSFEETLIRYKEIIDGTPNKWLQYHLDWSIKEEEFELAAYIRDSAKNRNVNLNYDTTGQTH